jgi:PqqA peptide cyclase
VTEAPRPYTLVAELTHRCPLSCPYCSNPTVLVAGPKELPTGTWERIFREAEELGVVQLHLTGGEPLARPDLERLVATAHALSLYVQLVTSGVPLTRERLSALRAAGLDAVQLSIQGADAQTADPVAGYPAHAHKLEVARWVKQEDLPLTLNAVIHRHNAHQIAALVALAESLGADRLELANAQYAGWAEPNRDGLLPSEAQIREGRAIALAAKERLRGRMEIVYVTPDYFSGKPKACMDGWARRYLHLTPDGVVLPCQGARSLPGLEFWDARERSLVDVWRSSPGLVRYRGEDWMREPCRTCDRRALDFGGCRCQAFLLTGEAENADPACSLSPHHDLVTAVRARSNDLVRLVPRGRSAP